MTYIRCDESELAALRERLGQWLDVQDVTAQRAFDVKLVAHEAARSAIENARPCAYVQVGVELTGEEIVVRVFDTGAFRPRVRLVTAGCRRELDGLALIHALATRVEAVREDDGTALVMTLARA